MRQKTRAPGAARANLSSSLRAVEGKKPQARVIGKGNVLFLFYRIAERQTLGGDAIVEAQLDLATARHVEIGALALEHPDDRRRRIGLDRVENACQRQVPAQCIICPGDCLEIDNEAWGFRRVVGEEARDPLIHSGGHPCAKRLSEAGAAGRRRDTRQRQTSHGRAPGLAEREPKPMPARSWTGPVVFCCLA